MNIRFDRIEEVAKLKNISIRKILAEVKQSPNNFVRWKKGESKPSYSSIQAIADFLNVDVRYFLDQTDSPTGQDIIENAVEKLLNIGIEIESSDNDNGTGQEYVLTYHDKSYNYQEHEFRELCLKLLQFLNDSEIQATINFCNMMIER